MSHLKWPNPPFDPPNEIKKKNMVALGSESNTRFLKISKSGVALGSESYLGNSNTTTKSMHYPPFTTFPTI